MTAPLLAATRPAVLAAGPAATASLVLFVAAVAVSGGDVAAVSRGPLGVTANALALLSLLLLVLALVRLAARPVLADRAGTAAVLLAGGGTVLAAGGAWTQLLALPVFAVEAPRVAEQGAGPITAGYVVSFLLAAVGWLLVARRLRRDDALRRGRVRLLLAGAVLVLAPLPSRWFLLAIAVTLLAAAEKEEPVAGARPVPVPA